MVCMFVEGVKGYCFLDVFFGVIGLECLSLDVASLSVERCSFPLSVDYLHM